MRGAITIEPPLGHQEIDPRWSDSDFCGMVPVVPRVEERVTDSPEGTLIVRSCSAIVPTPWNHSAGSILDSIEGFIEKISGHEFGGYLECQGEEIGDLFRIVVQDRTARIVYPDISWKT